MSKIDDIRARLNAEQEARLKRSAVMNVEKVIKTLVDLGLDKSFAELAANAPKDIAFLISEIDRLTAERDAKEAINRLYNVTVSEIGATKDEAIRRMRKAETELRRVTAERDGLIKKLDIAVSRAIRENERVGGLTIINAQITAERDAFKALYKSDQRVIDEATQAAESDFKPQTIQDKPKDIGKL